MIQKVLENLGWSDKEATVYLTLLEHSSLIVSDIAKYAKINRVTVYDLLEKLMLRGAISKSLNNNRKFYSAVDPELLYKVEKEKILDFSKSLHKFKKLASVKPKKHVRFFEGSKSLSLLLTDIQNSNANIIKCFLSPKDIYSNMPDFVHQFIEQRVQNNYIVHAIMPDTESTRRFASSQKEEKRVIKFVPDQKFNFNTSFYCTNSKLYIIDFQNNINSILIEDQNVAESLEAIFDMCWEYLN